MKASLFTLMMFLCLFANAQRYSVGVILIPQHSHYSISEAYTPRQMFSKGLATGVSASYYASDNYNVEVQALYSFEKHEYLLLREYDESGTNNYLKFAVINNLFALSQERRIRPVTGLGFQVSRLVQSNARKTVNNQIVSYYDDYAKVDFALVGKLGVAMTFDDTVVGFGMRYDRGLIDITGCGTGRAYNNNIGFYISLSALK